MSTETSGNASPEDSYGYIRYPWQQPLNAEVYRTLDDVQRLPGEEIPPVQVIERTFRENDGELRDLEIIVYDPALRMRSPHDKLDRTLRYAISVERPKGVPEEVQPSWGGPYSERALDVYEGYEYPSGAVLAYKVGPDMRTHQVTPEDGEQLVDHVARSKPLT